MSTETSESDLLIDRLEIRDFRQFEHLEIKRLARVNLIVGKNGVGKTSLLEAIRILATIGARHVLWQIVLSRDEQDRNFGAGEGRQIQQHAFMNLFRRAAHAARMSFASTKRTLVAELAWYRLAREGDQLSRLVRIRSVTDGESVENGLAEIDSSLDRQILEFHAQQFQRRVPLTVGDYRPDAEIGGEYQCMQVGSAGISVTDTARLWDKIALTSAEDEIISSLAIIYPGLTRISLAASEDERVRTPRAKLRNHDQPVPLKTLGDGVNRIFGIALALVNAKGGILLIDEIENGIHYSAQPEMWRFLAEAARRLNVQIFATTHSTDAINAFQWAVKTTQVDGLLTRIEEKGGRFAVTQFDNADLGVAVAEAIEVR